MSSCSVEAGHVSCVPDLATLASCCSSVLRYLVLPLSSNLHCVRELEGVQEGLVPQL